MSFRAGALLIELLVLLALTYIMMHIQLTGLDAECEP